MMGGEIYVQMIHSALAILLLFPCPLKEVGVYCPAHVGQLVCQSVYQLVPLNLVHMIDIGLI